MLAFLPGERDYGQPFTGRAPNRAGGIRGPAENKPLTWAGARSPHGRRIQCGHHGCRWPVPPAACRALRRAHGERMGQAQLITGNRRVALVLTVMTAVISVAAVQVSESWFSPGLLILPVLAGGLLLWPRALRILFVLIAAAWPTTWLKAGLGRA